MMNTYLQRIFLTATLTLAAAMAPARGASIRASLDSAQITMGYQTAVRLDIVESASRPSQLLIQKDSIPAAVEVVDWVAGDTTALGNDMRQIQRALIIQSFDSGVYVIPPFILVTGPDTLFSNPLTLKVNPVDVSQMKDINPLAPPAGFESRWYDFLPDWLTDFWGWYLLAILVIAGGVCAYLIFTKKMPVNLLPQKKRLPPYQIAMNRLNALRDEGLWERGQEKEYYTRLTDILREYLAERFGINAMEMTSTQILQHLRQNDDTRLPQAYMQKILEIADFVKFAKVRPMPDDNVRSFQNALRFVEETRPVEQPQTEGDAPAGTSPKAETTSPKTAATSSKVPKTAPAPTTPNLSPKDKEKN